MTPASPAAHALIISTTLPGGHAALSNFILEKAFFTMSIVGLIERRFVGQVFRIPLELYVERSFHNIQPTHSALPPCSMTFP